MEITCGGKFKAAFFDLDGTLTDPKEGITNSVAYALEKFKITEDKSNLIKFIGPPLFKAFKEFYGFDDESARSAVNFYREYFADRGIFENRVLAGATECLRELKRAGVKIFLATSKPQIFAERILDKFDLTQYFDFVAGATMTEERSEKEQVLRYALDNCALTDPKKLIMVGDRKHDILGAKLCGIKSCGVLFGYGSLKELQTAGADYLARDFEEVKDIILGKA